MTQQEQNNIIAFPNGSAAENLEPIQKEFDIGPSEFIAESAEMKRILKIAENAAGSKASVLITGASGTGKDMFARMIHNKSARSSRPIITINCASLPEGMIESELFGQEKSAVNGALQTKIGKIELAHGSTLLIDEINDLDGRLQAKLLRVIQEGTLDRVGGKTPVKVNVRIIATSTRDLKRSVEAGTFRKDLFYRLNMVPLHVPSLKERKEDIVALMNYFVKEYAAAHGKNVQSVDAAVVEKATAHNWPGNVRELQNIVSQAVLMTEGEVVLADHFVVETPVQETASVSSDWKSMTLGDIERTVILDRLREFGGNRTHSSRALGISIRTLRNKIREYKAMGIDVP